MNKHLDSIILSFMFLGLLSVSFIAGYDFKSKEFCESKESYKYLIDTSECVKLEMKK